MTSTNESVAMDVDGTKQQSCPTKKMRLDVPLHQAVEEGMLEYLESQFKAGVDINKKKSNGWALIHTAVSSNQFEVVKQSVLCMNATITTVVQRTDLKSSLEN